MGDWTFFGIVMLLGLLSIGAILIFFDDSEVVKEKPVARNPDIEDAIATAEKRLALSYNVDEAIAQAEQLLQAIHDEESE